MLLKRKFADCCKLVTKTPTTDDIHARRIPACNQSDSRAGSGDHRLVQSCRFFNLPAKHENVN